LSRIGLLTLVPLLLAYPSATSSLELYLVIYSSKPTYLTPFLNRSDAIEHHPHQRWFDIIKSRESWSQFHSKSKSFIILKWPLIILLIFSEHPLDRCVRLACVGPYHVQKENREIRFQIRLRDQFMFIKIIQHIHLNLQSMSLYRSSLCVFDTSTLSDITNAFIWKNNFNFLKQPSYCWLDFFTLFN